MYPALLYKENDNDIVDCLLCSHYCEIKPGKTGTCKLRKNVEGKLYTVTWGMAQGLAVDPVEKKPFFHFKPGSRALSFGTNGCNFRCKNCQNSHMSQAYEFYNRTFSEEDMLTPEIIAHYAEKHQVDGIAYTYSEPTIFFEYARDTILECRKRPALSDIYHVFVSNGYFSREMLDLVLKENLLDAVNIDLKFINDEKYRKITGGSLQPVLDNIARCWDYRDKIHIELINLVIPDENDSDDDLRKLCGFVASISPEIPIHFSRFYPRYKMSTRQPTSISTLLRAKKIANDTGLKYIFIGNTSLNDAENTYCPECGELLIERSFYGIRKNLFNNVKNVKNPPCPNCGHKINIVL